MDFTELNTRGLVLLGCGKMGSAMLAGWLSGGLNPQSVWVLDPAPSDWLSTTGVHVNDGLPSSPAVAVIAVKPQMMGEALPALQALGTDTVMLSIAAGTPISGFEASFPRAPIVRAMPNTPAAIGKGITAMVGNAQITPEMAQMADGLLQAVGQVVHLDSEDQIDAVTGLSGSGPAYVFHLIECLAQAGAAEGLPAEMAMALAKATVEGAGALAAQADETPAALRVNVTSPNGTTQAGLEVLMDRADGLPHLIGKTVKAATERSRELKG